MSHVQYPVNASVRHHPSTGKQGRKNAFEIMAGHLKKESINDGIRNLSARNMQQRWIAYMRRFKTTLKTVKVRLVLD
ncbi:hypothetical protein F441_11008 [Phytophthora nicotianae CJ01A1]|uniref:Uncharacterized protein n=1 Tax=Phytophthora nicotianae CJ01A1 TaxID=1317063 RepID=W2WV19_PHYNI|nr:hypothetical protein F441_11008 [Phytophthora nicotianae CJ01A1]